MTGTPGATRPGNGTGPSAAPGRERTIRDGLIVGFIAYLSVAAFYAAFDVLAARGTLYTVNLLGKAVFGGAADATALQQPIALDLRAIVWYNAAHFALSLGIGMIVMSLIAQAERLPPRVPLVVATIVGGFFVTIAAVGVLSEPIRHVLPWWTIIVANSSAVAFGGLYIRQYRRDAWRWLMPFGG